MVYVLIALGLAVVIGPLISAMPSKAQRRVAAVRDRAKAADRVLVCLDSKHSHEHVLAELEVYAPLVTLDSYCVVFDTVIEQLPEEVHPDRPWGPGDNPMTAVTAFLDRHPEFQIDHMIDAKLALSCVPNGYLRRVSD